MLAQLPGSPHPSVQEIRCHVVWGTTMIIEYTFDKVGSYIFRRAYDGDNAPRDQLGVWDLVEGSISNLSLIFSQMIKL